MDKLNDEIRMTPLKWKRQIPSSRLQTKSKIPMIKRHRVALIRFGICGLGFIWDLFFWAFKIMTRRPDYKGLATQAACATQSPDGNVS